VSARRLALVPNLRPSLLQSARPASKRLLSACASVHADHDIHAYVSTGPGHADPLAARRRVMTHGRHGVLPV